MGWTNTQPDEVTAPGSVPFLPGRNVAGFGSQLPPELAAAGYTNAMVFYSNDWDPTATVPKAKFKFIGSSGGSLVIGMGYCVNPSVSQVATITRVISIGLISLGTVPLTDVEIFNVNDHSGFQFSQFADGSADPFTMQFDDAGNRLYDADWQTVTLLNGWAPYGTPGDWYQGLRVRKLPYDLGVQLNGTLQSPGTAQPNICNLPALYRPSRRATNVCNQGTGITTLQSQTNGDVNIDGPAIAQFVNINAWWVTS